MTKKRRVTGRAARIVCRRKVGNGLAAGKFQSQGTVEHAVLLPGGPVSVSGERVDLHAVVRLRGKGVPTLRNKNVRGDHYVTLVVQVPDNLTDEQKSILNQYAEASTVNARSSTIT